MGRPLELSLGDLSEGTESPVYTEGPISRSDIVRYAGAGGDFNPLHHDEEYATSLGLPSVFAMGLMHGGMLSHLVGDWLGLERVRRLRMRFRGQVWPGDTLTMKGVVQSRDEETERVETYFTVENQSGEVKLEAWATAAVDG